MKRKKIMSFGVIVLFSLALMSVFSTAIAAQKTFKLGICLALSGPAAGWGIPLMNGDEMVVNDINSRGGLIVGDDKYTIEIVSQDTLFTPEGAAAAAGRLVDKGVNLIHGCLVTHVTLAAQEVMEPAKILSFNTASDDRVIIGKKYAFRAYISPYILIPGLLNFVDKVHPEVKKLAQIGANTESGWFSEKLIREYSPRVGLRIVYSDFYEPGTVDFYPFLTKMLAKKPDIIYGTNPDPPAWSLIIKQARELGYKGLSLRETEPHDPQLVEIAGKEAAEGALFVGYATTGKMATREAKSFVERYTKKYGHYDAIAMMSAAPLYAIFQAIQECGSINSDKVAAQLESGHEYVTPCLGEAGRFGGKEKFGRNAQWYGPQYVTEVRNGVSIPIYKIPMKDMLHGWE